MGLQQLAGRTHVAPLQQVDGWLGTYRKFWEGSFDRMDAYLKELTTTQATEKKQ